MPGGGRSTQLHPIIAWWEWRLNGAGFSFYDKAEARNPILKGETSQVINIVNKLVFQRHLAGDIEEVKQNVLVDHIRLTGPHVKVPHGR